MTSIRRLRGALVIAVVVVIVDQLTKWWAVTHLDEHDLDVIGSLRFHLAHNTGMAFSKGTGLGPIIGVVALVVVVGLLVSIGRESSPLYTPAVGLIVGGAISNVIDRLFRSPGWLRGGVVDFIDVQWWPIFNVADICVTVGGVLLLLTTLKPAAKSPTSAGTGSSPVAAEHRADET
jgi:signal peptidase II